MNQVIIHPKEGLRVRWTLETVGPSHDPYCRTHIVLTTRTTTAHYISCGLIGHSFEIRSGAYHRKFMWPDLSSKTGVAYDALSRALCRKHFGMDVDEAERECMDKMYRSYDEHREHRINM